MLHEDSGCRVGAPVGSLVISASPWFQLLQEVGKTGEVAIGCSSFVACPALGWTTHNCTVPHHAAAEHNLPKIPVVTRAIPPPSRTKQLVSFLLIERNIRYLLINRCVMHITENLKI
jgi:hypothetical protein